MYSNVCINWNLWGRRRCIKSTRTKHVQIKSTDILYILQSIHVRHPLPACLSVCMAAEDQSPWWNPHGKDTRNGKVLRWRKPMKWCLIQSPSLRMVTVWQLCQDQRGHHILIGSKARNTKDVYIPCIFLHIPANHAYLCIFLQTLANLIISYLNSFFGPGRIALKTQFDSPTSPVGRIGGLLCPPSATWEQVDQGKTCRGVVICWPSVSHVIVSPRCNT